MAEFYLPDNLTEPVINDKGNRSEDYDSCSICFAQKLFPWNELRLKNCELDHRYCLDCIKESMSTGVSNLWGFCPGEDENGKSCPALATRSEMEFCGMEKEIIYSVLERTISEMLEAIEGWHPCDIPGCIGGRSNVRHRYFRCRLCSSMVAFNNDDIMSDPLIDTGLLKGLSTRGNLTFRECYHCAATYEASGRGVNFKCASCRLEFHSTYGRQAAWNQPADTDQRQRYVPKEKGRLWSLGVFKDDKGKPLRLGQELNDAQVDEVVRRANIKLEEYGE